MEQAKTRAGQAKTRAGRAKARAGANAAQARAAQAEMALQCHTHQRQAEMAHHRPSKWQRIVRWFSTLWG